MASLKILILPISVTYIAPNSFGNCQNLERMEIAPENLVYSSVNNCIVNKSSKSIVAGCSASIIPSDGSVTGIEGSAFYGFRENFTSIEIPSSITSIKADAFVYCNNLKTTIGSGWVKASDNSDMPSDTELWKLSDDIKRK